MKGGPASNVGVDNTTPLLGDQFLRINPTDVANQPLAGYLVSDLSNRGRTLGHRPAAAYDRTLGVVTISPAPRLWIGDSSYFVDRNGFTMSVANPRTSGTCFVICSMAFVVGGSDPAAIAANNTTHLGNPVGVIVGSINWTTTNVIGYNPAAYVEGKRPSISSVSRPSSNLDPTTFSASDGSDNGSVAIWAGNDTNEPKSSSAGLLGEDGGHGGLWLLLGFAAVAGAAVAGYKLYGRREG